MKHKITKKEIIEKYKTIISVSKYDINNLLRFTDADSYCISKKGLDCENYQILKHVIISAGNRPIESKNTNVDCYDIINKYEEQAKKIISENGPGLNYRTKSKKVNKLLKKCIKELLKEVK